MNKTLEEIIDTYTEPELHMVPRLRWKYISTIEMLSSEFEEALNEAIELGIIDCDELRIT